MSLNLTKWLCHFTTTANLTSCAPDALPWHTYEKLSNDTFEHKLGFLSAGNDVAPASDVLFADCEAFCANHTTCVGFTFQGDAEVPKQPVHCYWKDAIHFTPQSLTGNCLTPGDPSKPRCEPLPGEMGLGGYYGHFQGHWLSAMAFLINGTSNATLRARSDAALSSLSLVMDAWVAKYGAASDGYLFPFDPIVWDKLLAGHGAGPWYSVPFYTLHKLMAGLLDQYIFAGSGLAYSMVRRMAAWVHSRVEATIAAGGQKLWQKVLLTEWGGMNDVLYELYSISGDPVHLQTGRRFNGWVFTARLAEGEDDLADLPFPHANFHLPEVIGNARAFQLTGNATDQAIVRSFFAALTSNHSYCTGGSNSGECWQQPRDLANFLTTQTEESCTQYNVLKLARHLFQWGDAAEKSTAADFYERAILNGIIGNQNRGKSSCGSPAGCDQPGCRSPGARAAAGATSYIYMLPLGGAVKKPWGKSDFGFPCCWGTLSESFAKLADSIFFHADSTFYVNQFVDAKATWAPTQGEPAVTIEQVAFFPVHPTKTSAITVHVPAGCRARFTLQIRVPSWLSEEGSVSINGAVAAAPIAGSYLPLSRTWSDGDLVEVSFPPSLWTAPLNDYHPEHNATLAFMYGPLVLAGVDIASDIFVPAGSSFKTNPSTFITRNSSSELSFSALAADGSSVRMIPLAHVMEEQYVVYFFTAGTKPPQPKNGYCPHSQHANHDHGEEEAALISAGAPPAVPPAASPAAAETDLIESRGVQWRLDAEGRVLSAPRQGITW